MDVAARYGGDEFILLLPHASADDAVQVAQRIRDEYRQASAAVLRRTEGASMSIGVGSTRGDTPASPDQLVAAADSALYRAKEGGRDRVIVRATVAPLVGTNAAGHLNDRPFRV